MKIKTKPQKNYIYYQCSFPTFYPNKQLFILKKLYNIKKRTKKEPLIFIIFFFYYTRHLGSETT